MVDATTIFYFFLRNFFKAIKPTTKGISISFISFYHCKCSNMNQNDQCSIICNSVHDFGIVWRILLRPRLFLSSLNIFPEFSVWVGTSLHNLFPIDTLPMFEAWSLALCSPPVCWMIYSRPPACLSCLPYWDDLLAEQLLVGSPHEVSLLQSCYIHIAPN